MIELTLGEIAERIGGELTPGADARARVTGDVVIDSREVAPAGLFVALAGERTDGHDHAAAAVAAGAVAAIVSRDVGVPAIRVDDPAAALTELAHFVLERRREDEAPLDVIAITGSAGKTTVKDVLSQLLGPAGETIAPAGSLNNELGVPLTVLRVTTATRFLVLEMGARGIGHIAHLTRIARPDVSLVLNVGSAHVSEFGGLDATATAKGEIVECLLPDGIAVLNADDQRVAAMSARTQGRVLLTGTGSRPDLALRALDVDLDDEARVAFTLVAADGPADAGDPTTTDRYRAAVHLALIGEHQVYTALAAAGAALAVGIEFADIVARLGTARERSRWRMQRTDRPDGVIVVNDAYNANPESMRAALKSLAIMGRGRRTWAVLGEMLELGGASIEHHDAIGRLAVRLDISQLVVVGAAAAPMHQGAVLEGSWGAESVLVRDVDEAFDYVTARIGPGDVVLVKSSNASGLGELGDRFAAAGVSSDAADSTGGTA